MPTLNSYERVSIEKALITEGKYEFVIKQYTFFFYDDYYFSILVDDNEIVRAVKIQSDNLFKELKTYYTPENYSVYTMPDEVKVEHIKTIMHVPFLVQL